MREQTNISGPIFLIGYMGSGKTTLGRALAARFNLHFVDLDEYIEQSEGRTIREIFEEVGESGFREIEHTALRRVINETEYDLVACGGGTPCFCDNMELMNSRGITVFLDATIDSLTRRLALQRSHRPLIAALTDEQLRAYIERHLADRLPAYETAGYRFESDRLETPDEVEESCENFRRLIGLTDR